MRSFITGLFIFCVTINVYAQDTTSPSRSKKPFSLYGSFTAGIANKGVIAGFGIHYMPGIKWGININYGKNSFSPEQLPGDYYPAHSIFGEAKTSPDVLENYSLGLCWNIKEFNNGPERKIKLMITGGCSFINHRYYTFKSVSPSQGLFGHSSNYDAYLNKKNEMGFFISPAIMITARQLAGFQLAPVVYSRPGKISLGIEFSVAIGKIR